MPEFSLRPAARQDLVDIWVYSDSRWGQQQADSYVRQINDGFILLAETPEAGQDCSDIRRGYRKYPIGQHVIFYQVVEDRGIEIVRILHQRMDVDRHLPD